MSLKMTQITLDGVLKADFDIFFQNIFKHDFFKQKLYNFYSPESGEGFEIALRSSYVRTAKQWN